MQTDERPTSAGIGQLDKLRFQDFLRNVHKQEFPESSAELAQLLQAMHLATDEDFLNLAGLLLFAERPELVAPYFTVNATHYFGNSSSGDSGTNTRTFAEPLYGVFDNALAFIMRHLHKVQAGHGVNAPGLPEIPKSVFAELLANALVHREYLVDAPIRLSVFDNRIEIVSPGCLPGRLSIPKVKCGSFHIRNPILASYAAQIGLSYRGLGSGLQHILTIWPDIEFINSHKRNLFAARVYRKNLTQHRRNWLTANRFAGGNKP